jgi:hypothetical protein
LADFSGRKSHREGHCRGALVRQFASTWQTQTSL